MSKRSDEVKRAEEATESARELVRREAERKRKAFQESLLNATPLQAPATGDSGKAVTEFLSSMKELASNEFKFHEASKRVYRSTFTRKRNKEVFERNHILDLGKYDFEYKAYFLELYLWYSAKIETLRYIGSDYHLENALRLSMTVFIKMDPDTAAKIREGLESSSLSITIWYRFQEVTESWEGVKDISFEIDVLKCEYGLNGQSTVIKISD